MPFVHIELIEGRTEEQLTKMVEEVTRQFQEQQERQKKIFMLSLMRCKRANTHKVVNGNKISYLYLHFNPISVYNDFVID